MRREFIFILSGIIIVSTLTSLLANYKQTDPEKVLLVTVSGAVGPGDFAYWYIGHYGRLVLELNSLTGDADLYVSEDTSPSYTTDRNNYSSETCGQDRVYIPASFQRPFRVGVFGYWSHLLSEYNMQVFVDRSGTHPKLYKPYKSEDPEKYDSETIPTRKPILIQFLNAVETILDMIVL